MKKIVLTVCLVFALPVLASAVEMSGATTTGQETKQQDQYEKSMEERLRRLGKELDDLKARIGPMTKQARKEMDRHISDAEKKRKAASRKLEEFRAESREKLGRLKEELDAAIEEFEKAYKRARSRSTEQPIHGEESI